MSSASGRAGFSLVEVLIALAVMAIALLGLVAVLTSGLKAQHKSDSMTQAHLIATRVLDRTVRGLDGADDFWDTDHTRSPWVQGKESVGPTQFSYRVTAADVQNKLTGKPFGTAVGATDNRLRLLEATVSWAADSQQARVGSGQQEIKVRRLVNMRPE